MSLVPKLTDSQLAQYRDEGYMILERVISDEVLQMLREECSYAIGYKDAELDAAGLTSEGITHRGSRYFIANRYRASNRLRAFLFGDLMEAICRATLGDTAYLFNEQWVVKGAEQGMQFAWHQDSGYVTFDDDQASPDAYLTCWCALDDMNEENGTVHLLSHTRGGTRSGIVEHTKQEITNDLVGYAGTDAGAAVLVPAGSIVCFTSHNLHRSSANTTDRMRRVYLAQYSASAIQNGDGSLRGMAVPFLQEGMNVYDHLADTAKNYGPTSSVID